MRKIIILLLIIFTSLTWVLILNDKKEFSSRYQSFLSTGQKYEEMGITDEALTNYIQAYDMKRESPILDKIISIYIKEEKFSDLDAFFNKEGHELKVLKEALDLSLTKLYEVKNFAKFNAILNKYSLKIKVDKYRDWLKYDYEVIDFPMDAYKYSGQDPMIFYKVGDKWGVVDLNGKVIILAQYEDILAYDPGDKLFTVKRDGEFILVNTALETKAKLYGKVTRGYRGGFYVGELDGSSYQLDKLGNKLDPIKEEARAEVGEDPLISVKKDKTGFYFVNDKGESLNKSHYQEIKNFDGNGVAFVKENDKWKIAIKAVLVKE